MFGTICPNEQPMTPLQKERYHAYYCGVCHSLGKNHNNYCKTTLSYDMTFLALFLDGFDLSPDMTEDHKRCSMRPRKKHKFFIGKNIDYAAEMNIILAFHKLMDDWHDERKILRRTEAELIKKNYRAVKEKYPRQCHAVESGLDQISVLEARHETNPDRPTQLFGKILGEIFVPDPQDQKASGLRRFGETLGRLIYIYDAVIDLKADLKKKRYNPLTAMTHLDPEALLSLFLGDCVQALESLPKNHNQDLIDNVLFSGVWIKYAQNRQREEL